jgi:hypothetical protein
MRAQQGQYGGAGGAPAYAYNQQQAVGTQFAFQQAPVQQQWAPAASPGNSGQGGISMQVPQGTMAEEMQAMKAQLNALLGGSRQPAQSNPPTATARAGQQGN